MKILLQNLRRFFMEPPDSEEELLGNSAGYMSMVDSEWLQSCKPASQEDIACLEETLAERFGCGIPSSYRAYLESIGEEDGGLVSERVESDSEFWSYFKGDNMAQGAAYYIKHVDEKMAQSTRTLQDPPRYHLFGIFITQCLRDRDGAFPQEQNARIRSCKHRELNNSISPMTHFQSFYFIALMRRSQSESGLMVQSSMNYQMIHIVSG